VARAAAAEDSDGLFPFSTLFSLARYELQKLSSHNYMCMYQNKKSGGGGIVCVNPGQNAMWTIGSAGRQAGLPRKF